MIRITTVIAALVLGLALAAPVAAQDASHETAPIAKQPWTFTGPFGTFDKNQLQRGFQVFQNVCANCHGAHLMSFRNLEEAGGPEFSEEQVKALAASYTIADATVEGGERPGVPADRWPAQLSAEDAILVYGVVPPDLSVMAKARSISQPFPWWVVNLFTGYAEGGPDYIHALMLGYEETVPEGTLGSDGEPFVLPEGKYFNHVFPGYAFGMPPQLFDGAVTYEDENFPQTADQYAADVSAFLMWVAEPHLIARKESGLRVMVFLILFAGLMWFVKQKLWGPIHRHNPSPEEVAAVGVATAPPADPPRGNH